MGLLDDLRKKSTELQEQERSNIIELEHKELIYQEQISPCLKHIYSHLCELTQHLNYLQQELLVSYVINSDGLKHVFQQQEYQLEIDSTERTKRITFRFKCVGPTPISYHISDGDELPKHLDFLNHYNLTYSCKPYKNDRHQVTHADIDIKAYIPITFVFEADVENSVIKLHISNFDSLGFQTYNIYLDKINDQFYENIVRYIIREQVDFLNLDISDQEKQDIRRMVADELKQRQFELDQAIKESNQLQENHSMAVKRK